MTTERMITEKYVNAYQHFLKEELSLAQQYSGQEYARRIAPYYQGMIAHITENYNDYILFNESNVTYYELEFVETVEPIRDKLFELAKANDLPYFLLFIPRIKIEDGYWDRVINLRTAKIIRQLFDEGTGEDFETLKKFKAYDRNSQINRWIKSKNGKNFLFEFQVSEGIRPELIVKRRLYLFDKEFVRQQMQWMSEKIWIHKEVVIAFEKWEKDKKLWSRIDHIKRKIALKEILDESRPEIKFLRMMENLGLKGRFIHDENISWQLKYRPDFWFINENLIVEFDEEAHKFRISEDIKREKIIKKHIPKIHFIRVREGFESDGLTEILKFLEKNNIN